MLYTTFELRKYIFKKLAQTKLKAISKLSSREQFLKAYYLKEHVNQTYWFIN